MRNVTIKDIAKEVKVSPSTVSRALADDPSISIETKEKVTAAATRLGYRPNPLARSLKSGSTRTIAVIVPRLTTPFSSHVIRGVQHVLKRHNLRLIIADSEENVATELENLRMMEEYMVDGILISLCSYRQNGLEVMRLQRKGVPIVCFDRIPHGLEVSQVVVDDYHKSFFLVESLIRSGRRNIAHLQGSDEIYNSHERLRGYRDALKKFGIPFNPELVISNGVTMEQGKEAIAMLMERNTPFDAIFSFSETLAFGAMHRLKKLGRRIPDDVAVAGFSGTELSNIVYPSLTAVEPPAFEMGEKAAELLLEKLRNPQAPATTVTLDAKICMRETTI